MNGELYTEEPPMYARGVERPVLRSRHHSPNYFSLNVCAVIPLHTVNKI